VTLAELRIDIVVLACAVSAGIHAALVPDHFDEGVGAGVGFVGATLVLSVLAVVLTRSPSEVALAATAAVFAGLIASYVLVLTTGVPVLHPDTETLDGLALFTKAVEVVGCLTAASVIRRPSFRPSLQLKGTPT
jgi:CHASE2 domain-containing sensor protein